MAKHVEAVGSFDDFKAPWETDAGETEINKDRLKRYIFGLVTDKAKAQDARDETTEKLSTTEKERDTAKAELAKGDSSGKISELQTENGKLKADLEKATVDRLRIEVGAEKGLTPKQAARLQGSTKEEIEADADEILETFGVAKQQKDQDDDDEDLENEEGSVRRQPRTLTNPADREPGTQEIDYEKVVAGFGNRISI